MVYLAAAFIGLWLLVTLYVVYLGQRQGQLEQELRTLEEAVGERERQ
ncbi:MAG: CcmD family protein [Caldilineaceae bacterium]|nr:CcmD family protein [Caldilineaceae bacterium]